MEEVSAEQDELFSIVSNGQRGRIEDQRCTLTPITKPRQVHSNNSDPDELFQLLVKSQCNRLDDQRVALSSLPGMEAFTVRDQKDGNLLKTNFDQLCNIVSRAQDGTSQGVIRLVTHSFRKNSKTTLSPGASDSIRRLSFNPQAQADADVYNTLPTRSASFSPISDQNKVDYENLREQEQLLCLVSQAQCGRMEEQRCSINPLSPGQMNSTQSDQEVERFFKLIANTQNSRLDDQRATLNMLPVVQSPTAATDQESDQLFNMVCRLQGSRIDDQRCSAPKIQLGSPAPPRKSHSRSKSPNNPPSESGSPSKSSRRSGLFSPTSEVQNSIDQERFFSLVNQVQQGRMDDQRCSFVPYQKPPSSPKIANPKVEDPEQFFNLLADFQNKGLDDQRVSLSALPGMQPARSPSRSERNKTPTPQIFLTPASPAAPKKVCPSSSSPSLSVYDADRPVPRSASFCPMSDADSLQYDDMHAQISFQISMRFPPHHTHGANNQPYVFPEVFLTIGQAGETMVLPLNPRPGRPISLSVNPPRNHRSRSPSPHRSPGRQKNPRPSTPHQGDVASPIGPYEDYFSLIQRVHSSQLQQSDGRDRAKEMSKEEKKGKVKSTSKKEKKEGNKEKKK